MIVSVTRNQNINLFDFWAELWYTSLKEKRFNLWTNFSIFWGHFVIAVQTKWISFYFIPKLIYSLYENKSQTTQYTSFRTIFRSEHPKHILYFTYSLCGHLLSTSCLRTCVIARNIEMTDVSPCHYRISQYDEGYW